MSRRNIIAAILALIVATVCVRLGIWQLDRLAERRAQNAQLAARANRAPVMLSDIPPGSVADRFRRVRVRGTFDFDHELVVTGRTRDGSPGVNIITPLRLDGSDRVVLV
ncbi:MAG: SURF1 family protein, partial [Chloroflexota bacterium]|nr:SURF1 family protein [Chloroflexota bacterium]